MLNTAKIKGRLVELSLTQRDASKALGLSQSVLNQKLNNIRPLKLNEAELLAELLEIRKNQFADYFFTH